MSTSSPPSSSPSSSAWPPPSSAANSPPQPVLNAISIYLVFSIALQGGTELAQVSFAQVWKPTLAAADLATLPQANPGIYLTTSLGITFPFNLLVGLPIYYQFSLWLAR